jgi:hypothetical protein
MIMTADHSRDRESEEASPCTRKVFGTEAAARFALSISMA